LLLKRFKTLKTLQPRNDVYNIFYDRPSVLLHVVLVVMPAMCVLFCLLLVRTTYRLRTGVLPRFVADSCAALFDRFLNYLYKLIISSGFLGVHLTMN
jgi:hypothetical protein